MNPSYIFLPLLALLLAGVLLLIYYRMALRFALQAIDPQRMNYGAVLRQEMERNQLDPDRMDVKYDKLFLVNQHGQELTARLYLTPSQTDRYILFLHGYNYPWIGVLKYLPMLLRLGFNVLVPDLQAQGESQGSYITFGALESDDCLEWLEQIHKHAQVNGFNRARVGGDRPADDGKSQQPIGPSGGKAAVLCGRLSFLRLGQHDAPARQKTLRL